MGTVSTKDDAGTAYLYRTTTGDSKTRGVEAYLEYTAFKQYNGGEPQTEFSFFTSTSYFDAKYVHGTAVSGGENKKRGREPCRRRSHLISRNGIQFQYKSFQ